MSEGWKDHYRERKAESGKTWAEFIVEDLHHEDDLDDLRTEVDRLQTEVGALAGHVAELRRNLAELRLLDEWDEGGDR